MKKITELIQAEKETKILRLAPYCRVSSDSEDQLHSFASQIKYYSDYTKKHPGFEIVDIYADEGLTGTCMAKRNDFNRMLRDCKSGKIDRVITKSVSRFARNTEELLLTIRMLKEIGISVYFEEQGIDTNKMNMEMIVTFPGMVAQKESETISGNMRWSYKKRMESGEFNCCRGAYGFKLIDGKMIINESEAKIIRKIFNLYLSGMGKQAIANMLNSEGIKKRYKNEQWYIFTIDYILNNERYMGNALLQKSYTTSTLPFKKKTNKGELPRYYVENSNPSIISKEIFESAQKLQKRKTTSFKKQDSPLSGIVICPDCGHTFRRQTSSGKAYLVCSYKAVGRSSCNSIRILEDDVFKAFNALVSKLMESREDILAQMINQLEIMQNKSGKNHQKIHIIDKQIADLSTQNLVIVRLHNKGILNYAEYASQVAGINEKICNLRINRRNMLSEDGDDEMLDNLKMLNTILEEYEWTNDFNESLFEQIVNKIMVTNSTELQFELIGGLKLSEKLY